MQYWLSTRLSWIINLSGWGSEAHCFHQHLVYPTSIAEDLMGAFQHSFKSQGNANLELVHKHLDASKFESILWLKGKCRVRSKLKQSFDLMNLIVEHILPKPFPVWPSRLYEILTSSLEDDLLPRIWQSLSTLLQAQDDRYWWNKDDPTLFGWFLFVLAGFKTGKTSPKVCLKLLKWKFPVS